MVRALLLMVIWSGFAVAQENDFAHLSTSGYGEVTVAPDSAELNVQVEQTNLNAEQAKSAVDEIVQKFIHNLTDLGASQEQVSSSNLFISPQYYYPKNSQPELIGYRAVRKVVVNVADITLLNSYLNSALEAGVTSVNRIELKVKDRQKYQLEATKAAIANAQYNAKNLAQGFNRQLGEVWRVQYRSQAEVSPPGIMRSMALEQANVFKDYQDTDIVISDNVDVIYKLK